MVPIIAGAAGGVVFIIFITVLLLRWRRSARKSPGDVAPMTTIFNNPLFEDTFDEGIVNQSALFDRSRSASTSAVNVDAAVIDRSTRYLVDDGRDGSQDHDVITLPHQEGLDDSSHTRTKDVHTESPDHLSKLPIHRSSFLNASSDNADKDISGIYFDDDIMMSSSFTTPSKGSKSPKRLSTVMAGQITKSPTGKSAIVHHDWQTTFEFDA